MRLLRSVIAASALAVVATRAGAADQVRISSLSDVAFGTISNFSSDSVRSESICLYAKAPPSNLYRVTASGSGAGGAFLLSSGSDTLPFEVQWSDTPNQTVGTNLNANQPLTGLQGTSGAADCSKGPATTASLIVILRSGALAAASSGTYTGTLTLLVAPE